MKEERVALAARLAQSRPRRLPFVAAALAIAVVVAATLLFFHASEPPVQDTRPAGEPLKLKLEFAFPAVRR